MKFPRLFTSLWFVLVAPLMLAAIGIDSQVLSLSAIEAKGISFLVPERIPDSEQVPVMVLVDGAPKGAKFSSMRFAVYDHPIDANFCKAETHKGAKWIRGASCPNKSWHFLVSGKELDNGFFVVEYDLPNLPDGEGMVLRYFLLLSELRRNVSANKSADSTAPAGTSAAEQPRAPASAASHL